jgi:hypothetical protein
VETQVEHPSIAVSLPFKIGGLALPMLNHNSNYHTALQALVDTLERHYSKNQREFFPIVSCGETCDALGYGSDLLALLTGTGQRQGYYFAHKSGETFKCPSSYADPELFACLRAAKLAGVTPLIIAVGGGVNGNSIGLIAALAGADFIEVPTTPMHFNDATTSAKKSFFARSQQRYFEQEYYGCFLFTAHGVLLFRHVFDIVFSQRTCDSWRGDQDYEHAGSSQFCSCSRRLPQHLGCM